MWVPIGVCPDLQCDERLWHAGLSQDGTKCFVAGAEDNVYIVWHIRNNEVLWRNDGYDGGSDCPPLTDWIDADGYIELKDDVAKGRYRVFGMDHNYAKRTSSVLEQYLETDPATGIVSVRDRNSGLIVAKLPFDAFSGDWAFASFSDDDSVIAVIEPYNVTFFGQV